MKLHISAKLGLPKDTVTSTLVVYGGKGMGKTNLGAVLVEELSKTHLKWCVLDPLGVWYGLRHSKNGKGPGVECVILGGVHGDMPVEPTGGAVVADLVVDEPGNVVIDFSRKPTGEMWSIGEKIRFVTEYTKRVFQRQGELVKGRRREPFMQILDEAARYVPQIIPHGNPQLAECLGAWETLVEEGRNIGIGALLLTQRSARMAKSVSEVADAMFSFRIVGPNSIAAVMDWLGEHVAKDKIKQHIEVLRSLERGRCLAVSPGWLQFEGVIGIRERETFDSSATPKPGERAARVTGKAAKPDLDKYLQRMKETIERSAANDPKKLQAKVAELQRQLKMKPEPAKQVVKAIDNKSMEKMVAAHTQRVTRPLHAMLEEAMKILVRVTAMGFEGAAVKPEEIKKALEATAKEISRLAKSGLERRSADFDKLKRETNRLLGRMKYLMENQDLTVDVSVKHNEPYSVSAASAQKHEASAHHRKASPPQSSGSTWNGDIPKGEHATLVAIGRYAGGVNRQQLTVLTGYKRSTRDAYIARLKEKGLCGDAGGRVQITTEGITALGDSYVALPATGAALQEFWMKELPSGEKKVLEVLIEAAGEAVDRDKITEATNFQRSTRDAYLTRLAAKELVEITGPGQVKASPNLFTE